VPALTEISLTSHQNVFTRDWLKTNNSGIEQKQAAAASSSTS